MDFSEFWSMFEIPERGQLYGKIICKDCPKGDSFAFGWAPDAEDLIKKLIEHALQHKGVTTPQRNAEDNATRSMM